MYRKDFGKKNVKKKSKTLGDVHGEKTPCRALYGRLAAGIPGRHSHSHCPRREPHRQAGPLGVASREPRYRALRLVATAGAAACATWVGVCGQPLERPSTLERGQRASPNRASERGVSDHVLGC